MIEFVSGPRPVLALAFFGLLFLIGATYLIWSMRLDDEWRDEIDREHDRRDALRDLPKGHQ